MHDILPIRGARTLLYIYYIHEQVDRVFTIVFSGCTGRGVNSSHHNRSYIDPPYNILLTSKPACYGA